MSFDRWKKISPRWYTARMAVKTVMVTAVENTEVIIDEARNLSADYYKAAEYRILAKERI